MDNPELDASAHRLALAALRRANRWLGVDRQMQRAIDRATGGSVLTILEVGSADGGWLAATRMRGAPARIRHWIGLDRSRYALSIAHDRFPEAAFICGDALALPFADQSIDIVTCSLLLHHFDRLQAVSFLRESMRVARRAVVVGDLSRSALAWLLTWITTRIVSRSTVFHVDGPRSVRAAYTRSEVWALALEAGMQGAILERAFPFRWLLTWIRPPERFYESA